ncbi:hypothetical protein SAMN06297387_12313 [Streptomyces zhaozhouensis]|uniref:Secreted protein n=1 Tax=Streptomyces zhaozhouensis TaxID=1300267 RepID=A0A286E475_9ACTN|nr:hypothetical protein [Streptomyces zhaozhouensis]SOD65693.1 hypothetical protein SAMN06297387_12313 [Streptomyces zhaozhouensis]
MRTFRVVGIIASSVAALGLTALAVTSANASDSGAEERSGTPSTSETDLQPTESGPARPGEGDVDLGPGVSVEKNEDGSIDLTQLTQEEVDETDGWEPVTPPAE